MSEEYYIIRIVELGAILFMLFGCIGVCMFYASKHLLPPANEETAVVTEVQVNVTEVEEILPTEVPVPTASPVPSRCFNANFVKHGNTRVEFNEQELSVKAQQIFEDKHVQFYFVTTSTEDSDIVKARKAAENAQAHIIDDYKVVLTVTDAGEFWFYGDKVSSCLSVEDKQDLFNDLLDAYTVTSYERPKANYFAIGALVVIIACIITIPFYLNYSIKKREIDAKILQAPLHKFSDETDALINKHSTIS